MTKRSTTPKDAEAESSGARNEPPPERTTPDRTNGRRAKLGKRKDIASLALLKDETVKTYQDFYKQIFFDKGALDRKTKELIAIAASAVSGCEGCLVGHIRKARVLGASEEEIKEAVAVAFAVNAAAVVDRTDVAAAMLAREAAE